MSTLNISTYEHLNLNNKTVFGIPEIKRYDLTKSKWNGSYLELEDAVFIFGFKASVFILTTIYAHNAPT